MAKIPLSGSEINLNFRKDFILEYKQLISSLENQQPKVDIPIINYHKFLLEQENFFNSREEIEIDCIHSKLDNVNWKISEVNQFFTALQRCGKHNPVEISRRIRTKTPLQVMMYIERLENELQYAKEIGRISKEPLNYEYIPAAREMSKKWTSFESNSANVLIQKLEENEMIHRIEVNSTASELKLQQDKAKIESFKLENFVKLFNNLDMKTKDKELELSDNALCSLYDVLRSWLTIIIHDLIILNQHHQRMYLQKDIKHLITVQEIRRVLRYRGYKIKDDLRQHMLTDANINPEDPSTKIPIPVSLRSNFLSRLEGNDNWSTDTDDDYDIEVEDNDGNDDNVEIDGQNRETSLSHSSNVEIEENEEMEGSDVEEYAKCKEQFDQDHKLELKESTIDKLYEKALVKLLREHSIVNQLREEIDKLESIFYHATMWNEYINHINLDKVLEGDDIEFMDSAGDMDSD